MSSNTIIHMLCGALLGTAAGIVATLLTRHAKKGTSSPRIVTAVLVAGAIVLSQTVVAPSAAEAWADFTAKTPTERMVLYITREMKRSPELRAYAAAQVSSNKTRDQAFAEGAALSARGTLRLDTDRLLRRAVLVSNALDRLDDQTCAKIGFGGLTREDSERVWACMKEEELREMALISVEAMERELRGSPAARAPLDDSRTDQLFGSVPEQYMDEFFRVTAAASAEGATDADRCAMTRYLYRLMGTMPGKVQADWALMLTGNVM